MTLELDDIQAMVFRLLSEARAWDVRNGSVTIHFDSQGIPVRAETREVVVYKKLSTDESLVKEDVL